MHGHVLWMDPPTLLMSNVFMEYLDKFGVVLIDDILVFSKTEEEHEQHMRMVLHKL